MFDARAQAARAGVRVEVCDLGAWDGLRMIAEYDAAGPAIRLNRHALDAYARAGGPADGGDLADLAIAHELFHHAEATGRVARAATRAEREAAADADARSRVAVSAALAAFLGDLAR